MGPTSRESATHAAAERVEVRQRVLDAILAHALRELPCECCGILLGTDDRVEDARPARNLRRSSTRYLIDPRDQFAAMREARDRGQTVVGFYHSHPASAPEPSARDEDEAAYPGSCYVIVSPAVVDRPIRAFRLHPSGNFRPVTLVPLP